MSWFAVVTFGAPAVSYRKVSRDLEGAITQARKAREEGHCPTVRVLECPSRIAARHADIADAHFAVVWQS